MVAFPLVGEGELRSEEVEEVKNLVVEVVMETQLEVEVGMLVVDLGEVVVSRVEWHHPYQLVVMGVMMTMVPVEAAVMMPILVYRHLTMSDNYQKQSQALSNSSYHR